MYKNRCDNCQLSFTGTTCPWCGMVGGYDEGCDAAGVYPAGGTIAAGLDGRWRRLASIDQRRRYPDTRIGEAKNDMWTFDVPDAVKIA